MIKVLSIIIFIGLSISLIGQSKSKIIRSIDDLKTVEFGDQLEIIPFELKFDEETGMFIDLDRFDKEVDEIYAELDKMFFTDNKDQKEKDGVEDKFAEIRNLTAKQIASDYTVKENKVWAKLLGLKNYSRLTEPILSELIFQALNK